MYTSERWTSLWGWFVFCTTNDYRCVCVVVVAGYIMMINYKAAVD